MNKIGLKVYSDNDNYLHPAKELYTRGLFDFVEVFLVPGKSRTSIVKWMETEIPLAFHAPHSLGGFNPASISCKSSNEVIVEEIADICNMYLPLYLVFHGGTNGSTEEAIRQFDGFFNKYPSIRQKALIENKPLLGLNDIRCIGGLPEDIRKIMAETEMGFCLDFGHAMSAAKTSGVAWKDMIKEFLNCKPMAFHLSDGHTDSEEDEHLHLGEGDFELKWFLKVIQSDRFIALETIKNSMESLDDFKADAQIFRSIEMEIISK